MAKENKAVDNSKDNFGRTWADLILSVFNRKILAILAGLVMITFIGVMIYIFILGQNGRGVKTLLFSFEPDPLRNEYVLATCSALRMTPTDVLNQDPTITPLPTQTSHSGTVEPLLHTWYDFQEDCIPVFMEDDRSKKVWSAYPTEITLADKCLSIPGFTPIDKGLRIFSYAQELDKGLRINIPEDINSISFSLEFESLRAHTEESISRFYYGFISSENRNNLFGEFIRYQSLKGGVIQFYRTQYPKNKETDYIKKTAETTQDVSICLNTSGSTPKDSVTYMTVYIDGALFAFAENIKIDSKDFIIGAINPSDGVIDLQITGFSMYMKDDPDNPCQRID